MIKRAHVGIWPLSKGVERVRQWPYALMATGIAIVLIAMMCGSTEAISIGGIILAIGIGADLTMDW